MYETKYILLIMNCKKYRDKALYQKQDWLQKIPDDIIYFHVIGDENLNSNFLFDFENNILYVKELDDYNSLPKKVIAAYDAVLLTYNFEFIFKTDDDQILVKPHLFTILPVILTKKFPKSDYGGYVVDVDKPYLSQYHKIHPELPKYLPILSTKYCTGRFYYLSKDAIIYLTYQKDKIKKEYLEDYAIGYHLDNKYKLNIMHITTNDFFTDIDKSDFTHFLIKNTDNTTNTANDYQSN
jgi:hypothetical protein